jgi:hypothetical protein
MLQKQMMEKLQNNFYIEANVNNKHLELYGPFSKEAAYYFIINEMLPDLKQKYKSSFLLSSVLYLLDKNKKVVFLKRNLSRINNESS